MNTIASISRPASDPMARRGFESAEPAPAPGRPADMHPDRGTPPKSPDADNSPTASALLRSMALDFNSGALLDKLIGGSGPLPQPPKLPPMDIKRATEVLDQNFDVYDTACQGGGQGDNRISPDDLRTVAANRDGKFSADQQAAAQFLMDSQAGRNFLDVANGKGNVDGTIGRLDVDAAKAAIADGSYVGRMIDTAANGGGWFNKGTDGHAGKSDLDAALNDPGVPQAVKDAIQLARDGQPDADLGFLGKLTEEQAQAASALVQSKAYQALTPEQKASAGQAFRDAQGDAALSKDMASLVGSASFQSASGALKTDRLRELALLHSAEFKSLPSADQQRVRDALTARKPGDDRLGGALTDLIKAKSFQKLTADEKTAVLSQMRNYPDARVAENFGKLLDKRWFSGGGLFNPGMSLQDKQRTLKSVAYLTTDTSGDATIRQNTLNRLLDPKSDYTLNWKDMPADGSGNITWGYATSADELTLNSRMMPADNGALTDAKGQKLISDTLPHEVSHAVNDDAVKPTFDYLAEEYRAWYVGEQAYDGSPPTNQEALNRWEYFLNPNGGYAGSAQAALKDPVEAAKIYQAISTLTGLPVTDEASMRKALAANPTTWTTNPKAPAALAPTGDVDN